MILVYNNANIFFSKYSSANQVYREIEAHKNTKRISIS